MYVFDGNLRYSASPGNFLSASITSSSTKVSSLTDLGLSFIPQNRLLPNSYLKIIFPANLTSEIKNGAFSCSLTTSNSELLIASCEYSLENQRQIAYVRDAFNNGFPPNISLSMLLSKIINYKCAGSSNSFTIESYTEENYMIDQRNNGITINFTEGELKNPSITPASNIVWDINKYEFVFFITNSLDKNSIIEIIFPNDIIVNKGNNDDNLPCELFIENEQKSGIQCKLNSKIVSITNFLINDSLLPSNTKFTIKVPEVQNKRNLKESELFTINSNFQTGCKLDKNYFQLKVKSTIGLKIKSIVIIPESILNGDTTSYDIEIATGGRIISGDQVKFSIPGQLTSTSGAFDILILGDGVEIKTQIVNKENNFFKIKIVSDVVETIKFKLLAIKNNYSLRPYDKFEFSILDSTNDTIEIYDNMVNPIILNQVSNKLLNPTIESPNSSSIIISFSNFNIIPLKGIIKIKIKPELDISSPFTCEDLSPINKKENLSCNYSKENSIITIENKFEDHPAAERASIKISLSNLKLILPSMTDSYNDNNNNEKNNINIDIETFEKIEILNETSNKFESYIYSIDKVIGLELAMGCNTFCSKCLANGTTCTECVSSQYVLKDGDCRADCPESTPFLYEEVINNGNTNKTCLKICPNGFYADSTEKKCIKCVAPCNECFSKTKCKNCLEGFLFYAFEKSCNIRCPAKSVKATLPEAKGFICVDCNESCLSCDSSDYNKCTSCASTKILYYGRCIDGEQCPKGTVAYEGKCAFCNATCEICSQHPNNCLKCLSGFTLDLSTYSCFKPSENCSSGYFLDKEKKCALCDKSNENCLECESEFACKKCKPGFSLESSKCVKSCSAGFYFDTLSMECKQCNASCKTCSQNAHMCTSCFDFSFLYDFKCEFACPEGFFKDKQNRVCRKCENTCKSCSEEFSNMNNPESVLINANSKNINNNNCVQCVNGLFLLAGVCIFKCPSNYVSDDPTRRCISSRIFNAQKKNIFLEYKKIETILNKINSFYFAYSALAVLLFFYFHKNFELKVFYFGTCSGLISFIDLYLHIHLSYLYFKNSFTLYFVILGAALCFRIILNNIFILAYNIHIKKDTGHKYWISYNHKSHFLTNIVVLIEFKAIRLTYSRIVNSNKFPFFDHKYSKYDRIHKLYRLFRLFDMLIVDIAIFLSGSLFLYFNKKYTYIWFLTAELIFIRFIIFCYVSIDFIVNKKIDQDFFYQSKSRIDVVPNLNNLINPYKEKYNLKIKGFENNNLNKNLNEDTDSNTSYFNKNKYNIDLRSSFTNNSNMNKNTECNTIKRSNSEANLFCDLLEKNKSLKNFYYISNEDLDNFIPRDDTYLIKSIENSLKYYYKILKDECRNNSSKSKTLAKAFININELDFIERKNSLALKHKNHKLMLNSNHQSLQEKNSHYKDLNSCPNFNVKINAEKLLSIKGDTFSRNESCSNFVNFKIDKNDAQNFPKVFLTEQLNNENVLLGYKNKNEKPIDYIKLNKENDINLKRMSFQINFEDEISQFDDEKPNIKIKNLNKNSFIFNNEKIENEKDPYSIYGISFMNLTDRSSYRLKEN